MYSEKLIGIDYSFTANEKTPKILSTPNTTVNDTPRQNIDSMQFCEQH